VPNLTLLSCWQTLCTMKKVYSNGGKARARNTLTRPRTLSSPSDASASLRVSLLLSRLVVTKKSTHQQNELHKHTHTHGSTCSRARYWPSWALNQVEAQVGFDVKWSQPLPCSVEAWGWKEGAKRISARKVVFRSVLTEVRINRILSDLSNCLV
jgi:hypothetical protein